MPGVEIPQLAKAFYSDYYDAVSAHALPEGRQRGLSLVDDFQFTREYTDQPVKFSFTGPFSLSSALRTRTTRTRPTWSWRLRSVLNQEAQALAAAGASVIQIDEPFLAGYPEQVGARGQAINTVFEGVDGALRAVHVCYGNRYARPLWEGHYDFLFPAILDADIDQLVLEFARKGYDDLELFSALRDAFPSASASSTSRAATSRRRSRRVASPRALRFFRRTASW